MIYKLFNFQGYQNLYYCQNVQQNQHLEDSQEN
jgi:hypothetical protein